MSTTLLNQDIVQLRQQKAPKLEAMLSAATALRSALEEIMASPLVARKPQGMQGLISRLSDLNEALSNKCKLFRNGVITVSVAGVEKSGKTTFLKNLTGIDNLPTADERCTSVSCEILYAPTPVEEGLDIVYYTRDELLGVVTRQLSYLAQEKDLFIEGQQFTFNALPDSIEAFAYYNLPSISLMAEEKRLLYEGALAQLWAIKESFQKYSAKLGTMGKDSLENLHLYASHKTADNTSISDLQAIIRKITIHKHFAGGAPFLRLCDTPGVDDPNPQALNHTFQAIKSETDLLIIANRPGNMPSITQPLAMFLSNLKKLDTSSPLRDRSIFFVNWHKSIDPEQKNAGIRIQKVNEKGVFPPSSIYGPCDIMDKTAISEFLSHINGRLRNDIPRQDNELIQNFSREWKSIQASVRTQVLEVLSVQAPPLPDEMKDDFKFKFDAWFREHFMGCMRTRMNEKTRTCSDHSTLKKLREEVSRIRKEKSELIKKWLLEYASEAQCALMLEREAVSLESIVLPQLAEKMTELVQSLTAVAEDIAPVIQEEVFLVIEEALGKEVAAKLSQGGTSAERLASLCEKLEVTNRAEDVAFITRNLREFANISVQMRCIMRHELRPALNLCDSFRWHANRKAALTSEVEDAVKSMPNAPQCKLWLTQAMLPSRGAEPEKHSDFYKKLFSASMMVIDAVLSSNSNKFVKLMEDYMADASQTLVTQRPCYEGWRRGLYPYARIILANDWNEIASRANNAEQYAELVSKLEDSLA